MIVSKFKIFDDVHNICEHLVSSEVNFFAKWFQPMKLITIMSINSCSNIAEPIIIWIDDNDHVFYNVTDNELFHTNIPEFRNVSNKYQW